MSDTPQENRPLQIALADVPDAGVVVTGFAGTETISRLSRFTVSLSVPAESPVAFGQLLGKPAVVSVRQTAGEWRYYHGILSRVAQGGRSERFIRYTAELVPPLWLLTRTRRSRIFQHVTTEEIIRQVVGQLYDLSGDAVQLRNTYFPRNYTAQYRESDFDFLSRTLEEEGIYYYFTHGDRPGIVFADGPAGHAPIRGTASLKFQPDGGGSAGRVTEWVKSQELKTGRFAHTDHCFEMPTNRLEASAAFPGSFPAGTVTHPTAWPNSAAAVEVDHPGGYVRWRDGIGPGGGERPDDLPHLFEDNARLARVRNEEEMAEAVRIAGRSTFNALTAGHKFALTDHPDADGEYVVTAVEHQAACAEAASSDAPEFAYDNRFTCLPLAVPFRPARTTPRPFIRGTQTAVVVGAEGAEIDPDKYGRVKVWFRWDPDGERGLDTSCWVRVAQFWAGKQWGAQFLPRVGDEVVVSFLDGSPDRPLVIGSVYNADNMPIYALPENKTQSGIKTHSSPGGTSQNFNEIKFEDKKGHELVSIHAERNLSLGVEVNSSTVVGNNSTVVIGTDSKADPHTHGKSTTTVFGDTAVTVSKGDYAFDVQTGKATFHVKGVVEETFEDTLTTLVTNGIDMKSKAAFVHIESPTEIKLTVGGSTLTITPDKIHLSAPQIVFEAGAKLTGSGPLVEFKGTADFKAAAPNVALDGAVLTSVKGALVKINC
ncbi:MAG: type VI secretion system tip protein TssI/VgrG [Gemmataceae bacterium]